MSAVPPSLSPRTEILLRGDFYVTGGTLRPDAPSYVERQADKELWDGLLKGEFCYVLTPRQMGKSSLMVRTVKRLREAGVAVAVLDLTAIGQNLTVEQWYDGLVSRLGQQLRLEDELLNFWEAHPEWGPLQRWTSALEQVVLQKLAGRVVVFVDEIDIVRSLPFSTDEFFAAIRECHNRRAHEPAFGRLAFGLLGVATPTDLIRDTRMTPFNIGQRIELNDFTPQEAAPLAEGLGADAETARELLARVLFWTGGHPYLTQRLCRALAEKAYVRTPAETDSGPPLPPVLPTVKDVDRLAEKLFLSRKARDTDDNLIFVRERILRGELDVAGLLLLYRKIHNGELVADDETNPLVSILHLSGIARGVSGYLQVRNRIYREVFDQAWIQTNMPRAEVRRQRKAGRRGMVLGFIAAAVLLAAYVVFGPVWRHYHEAALARETAMRLESVYGNLGGYHDLFESTIKLGLGGSPVPVKGSGSLTYSWPDHVDLALKSDFHSPELEVRFLTGPGGLRLYAPALNQVQFFGPRREGGSFDVPLSVAQDVGPVAILPLYRLLLDPVAVHGLARDVSNVRPGGLGEIEGHATRIIEWEHDPKPFLERLGINQAGSDEARIPVTAWVNTSNNLVLQIKVDLSKWASQLVKQPSELPITSLEITETHRLIQTRARKPGSRMPRPPPPPEIPGAHMVEHLDLPHPSIAPQTAPQREFAKLIPQRLPQTPPNLVDLSEYFNAAFAQTWHPGVENNNLIMLPQGLLQLDGTVFDVRGIVQIAGRRLRDTGSLYPQNISGIKIGLKCRQIHFLQGTGWPARDGVKVGSFLVHYADGQEEEIPIIYGEDVRDWNGSSDTSNRLTRGRIVWRAKNDANFSVRLFKTTWINPSPEREIATIDYVSAMADPAPFLIAITAEP